MSAQDQVDAILDAFNTALPTATRAYDLDEIPLARPKEYVEVTLSRVFGGQRRQCAGITVTGYRVTARAVSQVSVANVRNSMEQCRAALEFQRLTIGGRTTTPIQFETEDPAGSDDGWFSGLQSFTYGF